MVLRKVLGAFTMVLLTGVYAYAGELYLQDALGYYNEGVQAQNSGDLDTARDCYKKTLILLSGIREDIAKAIYNNLGVMDISEGRWESAARNFNEALVIDPDYKEVNFNMGIFYAKMGSAGKALAYWGKALNKTDSYMLIGEKKE